MQFHTNEKHARSITKTVMKYTRLTEDIIYHSLNSLLADDDGKCVICDSLYGLIHNDKGLANMRIIVIWFAVDIMKHANVVVS